MRLLKFRLWGKGNNLFAPEILTLPDIYNLGIRSETGLLDAMSDDYIEFSQFTGLLDVNNREVYEGDIVDMSFTNDSNGKVERLIGPIIWSHNNSAFVVEDGEWCEGLNGLTSLEVIGNIWQNPTFWRRHD